MAEPQSQAVYFSSSRDCYAFSQANLVIVVIVLRGMFGTAALKKKTDKEKLRFS